MSPGRDCFNCQKTWSLNQGSRERRICREKRVIRNPPTIEFQNHQINKEMLTASSRKAYIRCPNKVKTRHQLHVFSHQLEILISSSQTIRRK